jgi:RNA polymerase sigma-70 factor (ECF subfamily)
MYLNDQEVLLTDDAVRELAGKCVEGDVNSFEKLVRQFQSFAFALAMRLLADEDEASDVVQESFVRVWKHIDRYDPRKKFTTWLYTIVTNLSLDRLRALRRNRRLFFSRDEYSDTDEVQVADDIVEIQSNQELAAMIRSLTVELPMKQRLVFTLRDIQDLSVEEVAEIADMSIGSVKANLHYARRRIRRLMGEKYHVERLEP